MKFEGPGHMGLKVQLLVVDGGMDPAQYPLSALSYRICFMLNSCIRPLPTSNQHAKPPIPIYIYVCVSLRTTVSMSLFIYFFCSTLSAKLGAWHHGGLGMSYEHCQC